MSSPLNITLLEFARSFTTGRLSATTFTEAYIELWRIERDSGRVLEVAEDLSLQMSSIFIAADMYCADEDRRPDEFDETRLHEEVSKILSTKAAKAF